MFSNISNRGIFSRPAEPWTQTSLFGVLDGHGGAEAGMENEHSHSVAVDGK
jgi:serine/threonine protein phosphatase PrpC